MNDQIESDKTERWCQRIWDSRRHYFFQKIRKQNGLKNTSPRQLIEWMKNDAAYVIKWSKYVMLQLRDYGKIIRENYRISFLKQWYRMMYLVLVMRIHPNQFRIQQLFKTWNWRRVREYTFSQYGVQIQLAEMTSPNEVTMFKNKFLFSKFCRSHNLFTPAIFAVFENGKMTYPSSGPFRFPPSALFVKDLHGRSGLATKKFQYKDGYYFDAENWRFTPEHIYKYLVQYSKTGRGILVEEVVKNHSLWKNLTSGSLATCRVVTAKIPDQKDIIPLFCALRMPVGKADADNYFLGAGLVSSVDLKTGALGPGVLFKPYKGKFEYDIHPDTRQPIRGYVLPLWQEILSNTLELHKKVKTHFIGWDVCMTDQGFCVIDGNVSWVSGSYEIPWQKPLKTTIYPRLFERCIEKPLLDLDQHILGHDDLI